MNFKLFLLFIGFSILSSCGFNASKYYEPTQANATKAKAPLSILVDGKTAYINNCSSCHRLYKPSKYTSSEWSEWVNDMQERAEITDVEKANILIYLSAEIIE